MTMFSFAVDSMIMNKSIWEIPFADDDLLCECEVGDTHAVAIRKDIAGETTTVIVTCLLTA